MFQMRANIVAMGVIGAALLLPELAQAEQTGHASWYALHSRTASGEMMNPSAMTAASSRIVMADRKGPGCATCPMRSP